MLVLTVILSLRVLKNKSYLVYLQAFRKPKCLLRSFPSGKETSELPPQALLCAWMDRRKKSGNRKILFRKNGIFLVLILLIIFFLFLNYSFCSILLIVFVIHY